MESNPVRRPIIAAMDAFDGQESRIDPLPLSPVDNDVIVRRRFKKSGRPTGEVNYAMRESVEGWKVHDGNVQYAGMRPLSR